MSIADSVDPRLNASSEQGFEAMKKITSLTRIVSRKQVWIALLVSLFCLAGCDGGARSAAPAPASTSESNHAAPVANQAASQITSPTNAQGTVTLLDNRKEQVDEPPRVDAETQRRILQAVYGPRAETGDYSINSRASGSFTREGQKETVYLLQPGGPVAADPNGAQDLTLAIFDEANQLAAKIKSRDFNFIIGTSDMNGDGVNELLLEGSFFNMGTLGSSARLVELKDKRLKIIKDFDSVYENPCEGDATERVKAVLITYRPSGKGSPPEFNVARYSAPCPSNGQPLNAQSFVPAPDVKQDH
jgi:hypothetical protein